jgi:D-beta-D-heptose 7-phosphate kinase/D-beta-D-heptose 1-phosphate adenosyltransferase
MSSNDLVAVLERIRQPKVLVLGDLILDRYTWGNAERISQEAPVIVLQADRSETRPGGAANVANMLAALEATVSCCGVVGDDTAGQELRQLLVAAKIDCDGIVNDTDRPTSLKERFIGRAGSRHPNQILRVDREKCDPLSPALEARLAERLAAQVPRHDALVISDYGKGVCTPRLLKASIEAANRAGVPVLVDPSRTGALEHYRGATLIKPNRLEAELATGRKIVKAADAVAAGGELCQDLEARMALITLDRDGMILVARDGTGEAFPTNARAVYDITGAGDMVIAMIGLCLAGGASPSDAVRLANIAAGLEVERTGVAAIYRDEIRNELMLNRNAPVRKIVTLEHAATLAAEYRRRGEKVVFTNGCFDLLHVGHVAYLCEAARLGDVLVVGVNSDASVRKLKGAGRPAITEADRAAMLAALACVQHVVIFDDDTPHALLHAIRPDVLVKGGTYAPSEIVGHEIVEGYGGTVCVTSVVEGISTTNILASLARGETTGAVPRPDQAARWRRAS